MVVLADKHERYSIRCMTHPGFALSPGENRDREKNRERERERERNGTGHAIVLDVHIGSEVSQLEKRERRREKGPTESTLKISR